MFCFVFAVVCVSFFVVVCVGLFCFVFVPPCLRRRRHVAKGQLFVLLFVCCFVVLLSFVLGCLLFCFCFCSSLSAASSARGKGSIDEACHPLRNHIVWSIKPDIQKGVNN